MSDTSSRLHKRGDGYVRTCKACLAARQKTYRSALPKKGRPTGERSGSARLTWEKVRAIRSLYAEGGRTMAGLARELGVTPPTVRSIVLNKAWIETKDTPQ